MLAPKRDVRFRGHGWEKSGHRWVRCTCPLVTQSGRSCASRSQKLSVFDDFNLSFAAGFALERPLVVIYRVGLDAGQPHRRAAGGEFWMFDFAV